MWRWSNTGTGCPDKLQRHHPWRYSEPKQAMSWTTCSSWTCLQAVGAGLDDLQRPLPVSTPLWFCDMERQQQTHESQDNVTHQVLLRPKKICSTVLCLKNWNASFCKLRTDCKQENRTGKFLAHQIKNKRPIHEKHYVVKSHSFLRSSTHKGGWAFYLQFLEKILGCYGLLQHMWISF